MSELDELKAKHEAENASEVVTRYGIGVVAFEERLGEYVLRYEAETVPQLLELIERMDARFKEQRRRRQEKASGDVLVSSYLNDCIGG